MKYYISSGELQRVVIAENPRFAALAGIEHHGKLEGLHSQIVVGERGFDSNKVRTKDTVVFDTVELYNEALNEH